MPWDFQGDPQQKLGSVGPGIILTRTGETGTWAAKTFVRKVGIT
jgi:hypothetical protein